MISKPQIQYFKPIFTAALLFCLVISCAEHDSIVAERVTALPYSDTLSAAQIVTFEGDALMLTPLRILNIDDRYVIVSEQREENFFKVFEQPELNFLYAWGEQGQGPEPGEFIGVPVYMDVDGDTFVVHESRTGKLKYFSISDSTISKIDETILRYKNQTEPLNRMRRVNDTLYIADYGTGREDTDHEHIALKPGEDQPLFTFGEYPETDLRWFDRYGTYLKENMASKDGRRFAAFYFYFDIFSIYNSEGDMLKRITVDDPHANVDQFDSDKRIIYRVPAWASDKYIYLMGFHIPGDKVYEDPGAGLASSLEIWTWDGEPAGRYMFDRMIHNFTVSEEHSKLYGFSSFDEDRLFVYDLSEIFEGLK